MELGRSNVDREGCMGPIYSFFLRTLLSVAHSLDGGYCELPLCLPPPPTTDSHSHSDMATLAIRNITVDPLELIRVERFNAPPKPGAAGFTTKVTRTVTFGLVSNNATSPAVPKQDQEPDHRQDVSGIVAGPFETTPTSIPGPDPSRHQVLRLTFQTPGTTHRYTVDLPGPTTRSQEMRKPAGAAPLDLTAIYTVAPTPHLAIFSSASLSSWMAHLRNNLPLSMLSIPGTHNSPTAHTALPSVRCQAVGVRAQLDAGVRFLDVRVSVSRRSDTLALVHSIFPVALAGSHSHHTLAHLLTHDIYAFLDANPTETVLLSLKREGTGKGDDAALSRYLHGSARYCAGAAKDRWFTEPRIPLLGEARGKVVLVRRFDIDESLRDEHGGRGWGLDASAWPDNCADAPTRSGLLRVQDFYEITQSVNIEKKIELARLQLERACQVRFAEFDAVGVEAEAEAPPVVPLYVNFLSASHFFNTSCWPEKIAAKVNPSIIEYLCVRHAEKGRGPAQLDVGDAGTGIVVTDWVGLNGDWDLIRCIVGWNARLQYRK